LFANAAQKGRLMGAVNTLIAKPWRSEIYLQQAGYPHPVLRHELAHVVAGGFGQGPFKVAGSYGGWLPDPGRIEGFAEAAAAREDSDFSITEWAAAMAQAGLLPPLEHVFDLSFLGQNASTAYTAAGAFVVWLRSQYGPGALTAWYRGTPLAELTRGKQLRDLEAEFRRDLAGVEISARLKVAAEARFSLPSIFGRRCPHAVDAAFGRAQTLMGALDVEGAEEVYREVLGLDPDHVGARLGLGTCAFRRANAALAIDAYRAVADDERLALGNRLGAREAIADTEFLRGHTERARKLYSGLLTESASKDHQRTLEVKRLATEAPTSEQSALRALLLGSFKSPPSWDTAAPLLGAWRERDPAEGLPSYLLARNLFNRFLFEESAQYLDEALRRELSLDSVQREALRLRVIVGCARLERDAVHRSLARYLTLPEVTTHERDAALSIASRCGVSP
jgi:tetratricopeptide (TPR) repeat protein